MTRTELGSPPLARGTVYSSVKKSTLKGITPACAGNRPFGLSAAKGGWDHPRLRGEQEDTWAEWPLGAGSPPLARGTVGKQAAAPSAGGITPACAGNRYEFYQTHWMAWDHPRLRGEQKNSGVRKRGQVGSPPLARGTARKGFCFCFRPGITPACAGNR